MNSSKRDLLKGLAVGSAWATPVMASVLLPAHAQTTSASGCADGTTEVEWSNDVHGCDGPTTWQQAYDNQGQYCASDWEMAGSEVVNENLTGPGYSGDENTLYAFNGENCSGKNSYSSTGDGYTQSREECGWLDSHHYSINSDSTVVGLMCKKL